MSFEITTPLAAFWAGMVTSLHCVGMCGPLFCAFCYKELGKENPFPSLALYHAARLVSYALISGLAGGLGSRLAYMWSGKIQVFLPWAFVIFFVFLAFGWEKTLPGFSKIGGMIFGRGALPFSRNVMLKAGFLGLATPFIPCGPLYLVFGVCLVSGSWGTGALMGAAFALGTMPLMMLAQAKFVSMGRLMGPQKLRRAQCVLAIVSVLLLVSRVAWNGPLDFGSQGCGMSNLFKADP